MTGILKEWGLSAEGADLVVSELATNALIHARSPFDVTVGEDLAGVKIEVRDLDSSVPAVPPLADDAVTGRGLRIISTLAADWGVEVAPGGKTIWAIVPFER